jgi:RNA polymerase sigma-70 factor (ECF subfamily)
MEWMSMDGEGPIAQPLGAGAADADSIRAVWHAHRRWVAAIVLAHMPRGAELEDLLQEVAMRLVRHIGSLKDPSAIRPWLRTTAINVAITAGRRHKVRKRFIPRLIGEHEEIEASPLGGEDAAAAREEGRRAMELAQQLPMEYREPMLLRAVRGMSYRQIADVLGVPVTTVETRLVRARRMLREAMESGAKAETEVKS